RRDGLGQRVALLEQDLGKQLIGSRIVSCAVTKAEQELLERVLLDIAARTPLGEIRVCEFIRAIADIEPAACGLRRCFQYCIARGVEPLARYPGYSLETMRTRY